MNDEIKEILDNIKNKYEDYYVQDIVSGNNLKQLLDYITNLQQIEQEHKKINGELREEINRLEQENERLKEENKHIFANVNDDELLISNAMNYAEAQDYKSRCEKAIEYMTLGTTTIQCSKCGATDEFNYEDLLNILQNGSEKDG